MADSVPATSSNRNIGYVSSSTDKRGTKVSTDMFLKLLVAQVQYQDPLEPQSNTEMVTQLAQMNEMEQMQQMNLSLSSSQSYELMGKYAYAEVLDSKTGVTNVYFDKVTSIVRNNGVTYAVMGDYAVDISDISKVLDSSVVDDTNSKDTGTKESSSTQSTAET